MKKIFKCLQDKDQSGLTKCTAKEMKVFYKNVYIGIGEKVIVNTVKMLELFAVTFQVQFCKNL